MPTIKNTKEEIAHLESILAEQKRMNGELQRENKSLRLQADEYFEFWQAELEQRQKLSDRWAKLADYLKERREVNPSSIQYIKIEGMIRELEKDK